LRARALSKELRCMVCQNQSIDDSDAPLARDLRVLVRERLVAGDSDDKVLQFLTDRYGAFVLLKPQFNAETAVLWLAPLIVLFTGGIGLIAFLRKRRVAASVATGEGDKLTPAEQARITELMRQADK
jgi:cytochrome c-type biogenesis protein CcmH